MKAYLIAFVLGLTIGICSMLYFGRQSTPNFEPHEVVKPDTIYLQQPPPPEPPPRYIYVPKTITIYEKAAPEYREKLVHDTLISQIHIQPGKVETQAIDTSGRGIGRKYVIPEGGAFTIDHTGKVVITDDDRRINRKIKRKRGLRELGRVGVDTGAVLAGSAIGGPIGAGIALLGVNIARQIKRAKAKK